LRQRRFRRRGNRRQPQARLLRRLDANVRVRPSKAGAPPFLPVRGAAAQTGGFCFVGTFVCAKHTTAPPHKAGRTTATPGGIRRPDAAAAARFLVSQPPVFPFLSHSLPRFSSARSAAARFPSLKKPARFIPAESADAFFGAFFYFSVDISVRTCYAKQQKRL